MDVGMAKNTKVKLLWLSVLRLVAGRQLAVITTSTEEKEQTSRHFRASQVYFVRPGASLPVIPRPKRSPDKSDKFRLLWVGRIHPIKNLEVLIETVSLLLHRYPGLTCTIVGMGAPSYVETIVKLIDTLGCGEAISLVGMKRGIELSREYYSHDVVVVPSKVENYCQVIAESLIHGVPVIASTGTPWKELRDLSFGWYVDPNPDALSSAIRQAIEQRDELARMGDAASTWAKEELSWVKCGERTLEIGLRKLVED
jgi:glycosyltransferase involved in cell wall biosynthesis